VLLYLTGVPLFAQREGGGGPRVGSHGSLRTGDSGKSSEASSKQLNNFFKDTDSKLYSNISALATKDGTSITALQGMGFKNLGQMIAALHVYNNLGLASKNPPVSFADFAKAATTKSLGAAIKQYDPTANSSSEATKGTKQAKDDIKENA
jgi:hypothetical protein